MGCVDSVWTNLVAVDRWLHCHTPCVEGPWEAGCCRQVAALYSDHCRQVLLYMILLDQGRPTAVDRWLPYTVTTIDRFYCT